MSVLSDVKSGKLVIYNSQGPFTEATRAINSQPPPRAVEIKTYHKKMATTVLVRNPNPLRDLASASYTRRDKSKA